MQYTWLGFFGFDFLSDSVFEPLSAAVLMLFGIFYYWIAKQKKVSINRIVIIWSPVPCCWQPFSVPDFNIYNNLGFRWDNLYSSGFRGYCSIAPPR